MGEPEKRKLAEMFTPKVMNDLLDCGAAGGVKAQAATQVLVCLANTVAVEDGSCWQVFTEAVLERLEVLREPLQTRVSIPLLSRLQLQSLAEAGERARAHLEAYHAQKAQREHVGGGNPGGTGSMHDSDDESGDE